jgi:hypothetical protein
MTMVVMAAKWRGTCRVCGGVLPQGSQIEWTKETGARHVSADACAEALANSPTGPTLRGPGTELPEDRKRIAALLLGHPWKSATSKRYKKLPHQYTLRKQWADDSAFVWCVEYIRQAGYEKYFIGRVWIYYDIGEHQYWDCGGPVANVGLINRAVRPPESARLRS